MYNPASLQPKLSNFLKQVQWMRWSSILSVESICQCTEDYIYVVALRRISLAVMVRMNAWGRSYEWIIPALWTKLSVQARVDCGTAFKHSANLTWARLQGFFTGWLKHKSFDAVCKSNYRLSLFTNLDIVFYRDRFRTTSRLRWEGQRLRKDFTIV